jgi:predicted dehydrogenase
VITVAILGGGFMGGAHAANYKALGDRVRVKTVATRVSDKAARVAESVGAQLTTDIDAAINDPEVDAVDICLPTRLHREAAEKAFAAGKHVFLEKPIALELSEADELIQISRERKLLFTIGYSQRFNPKFAYVKRSLEDGTIGEPVSALVSRHITRNLGKKISGRVRLSPAAMESTHDLDFVLWCLAPRKPIRVYAQEAAKIMKTQYDAPDCVWMIVTMDDGTLFTVGGGWVLPPAYPNFASTWIEFVGTEGAVMVDDTHRDVYVTTMKDGIRFPISSMPGEKVNHVYAGPMEAETLHFLECVATGKQPLVTPEHARLVMLLYQAADLSVESNKPVELTHTEAPALATISV